MKSMCLNLLLSGKRFGDRVMSRWCESQWNFFKHHNTVILKVETSPGSFHGVFAQKKWNISIYNISDDVDDFDVCDDMW